MMNRVESQLEAVGNAEFIEDIVQMIFHRLLADKHALRHFLVLKALGDKDHDFALAGAESGTLIPDAKARRRRAGRRSALPGEAANHIRSSHAVKPELAGMDLADAFEEKFSRSLLWDDSAAALLHRFDKIFLRIVVGENDDARREFAVLDSSKDPLARLGAGGPAEQDNIRTDTADLIDRPGGRVGSTADFEVSLPREEVGDPIPEEAGIIYQDQADRRIRGCLTVAIR